MFNFITLRNLFYILTISIICSCTNKPVPLHTDVFKFVNKETKDTLKFYGFRNLDSAITYAKKEKKKILLVFSGWTLASARLEWKTLSLYQDQEKLYDNFAIVWLSVDDTRKLEDTSQTVSWSGQNRTLKTIGDKNSYFQNTLFFSSTQPFFCFIDTLQKPLGKTIGYTNDEELVEEFIRSGLVIN